MIHKAVISIDFFLEDLVIQILLLTTVFFLINTYTLLRKLWAFSSLVILLGLILANIGYELFISFLWLIELTFIIVFLLLILSFNLSLKQKQKTSTLLLTKSNIINTILFILFFILGSIYLINSNLYIATKRQDHLVLNSYSYIVNYYKENQEASLLLNDLKGLGFTLFNHLNISLVVFLILLTLASVLIVVIQLQTSGKRSLSNKQL